MPRWVLWAIAATTALAAIGLVIVLYRRRQTEAGAWRTADYLVALGIALALFGGVVSLLAAAGDEGEPPEVTAFRDDVRAACRALAANNQGFSLIALVDASGNIPRQRLIDEMNAGLDAGVAILGTVWAASVPSSLVDDVDDAHRTADVVLFIERGDVSEMETELPNPVPLQDALTYLQRKAGEHAAEVTAFEAAMSQLAGEPCRPSPST